MAFGGVHPFMLKKAAGGGEGGYGPDGGGDATGVIWDVAKWRCSKGKPNWDLDGKRFLGSDITGLGTSQVNSTISNGYGEGTHYAEFLVSVNDVITGAGVVSPSWYTGICSSDDHGATPEDSLQSYMNDQASGTWKVGGNVKTPNGDVSVSGTSVSNRIGIEVDVVGGMDGSEVRYYEVESDGTRTLLTEVNYMNDGVDFSGDGKASWAATSYTDGDSIRIYASSDDWWGTPTSGYVEITPSSCDYIVATGGTVTTDGDYRVHTFTEDDTFTVTCAGDIDDTVEYLVLAGGGGGGHMGGGGGGGYRTATGHSVTAQAYSIVVGDGGTSSGGITVAAGDGEDSSFDTITSTGGGGGGRRADGDTDGHDGGSGGGGSEYFGTGGSGGSGNTPSTSPVQGYDGGDGDSPSGVPYPHGGGGGGASTAGADADGSSYAGGDGGSGRTFYSVARGGGGGGAYDDRNMGTNGSGADGGADGASNGTAAEDNKGGGGGGAGDYDGTKSGTGGSGVVIIRYQYQTGGP